MRLLVVLCLVAALSGAYADSTIGDSWQQLLDHLKGLGDHALDKLKEIAGTLSNGTLEKLIAALKKDKDAKRGLDLEEIKQQLKDKFGEKYAELEALLAPYGDKLKDLLSKYGTILKGLIEKIKNSDSIEKVKELIEKIKSLTGLTKRSFELTTREAKNELLDKYLEQLKELFEKEFKDKLIAEVMGTRLRRDLGEKITSFFKPHVDKLTNMVQQAGNAAKDHAQNLWQNIQDSATDLQGKLQVHLDQMKEHGQTLVGHGKDAVDALQQSIKDILNQTFQNMVGTVIDGINTGKDAIDTVGNHIDNAVNQ